MFACALTEFKAFGLTGLAEGCAEGTLDGTAVDVVAW